MTNPYRTPSTGLAPDPTPVGWWDRAAIIALGGAGCALSYDALQQMAVAIHVRPQLSYLFPLVIDGFIAYGIRALLVTSTAPLRARLYTWTLFATATTASIWANALHAVRLNQQTHNSGLRLGDHVVAVLSTIAPLALAGAVHLYILITRHHPARPTKHSEPGPDQPTTLVPVRAHPDGTIQTGPHDPFRADHTHNRDHDRKAERTADRGPDHAGGTQRGIADHAEAGPPELASGPQDRSDQVRADQPPPDHLSTDHRGPDDQGPAGHGTATTTTGNSHRLADHNPAPAGRPPNHGKAPSTEPQAATEPAQGNGAEEAAPDPTEDPAGLRPSGGPAPDRSAPESPSAEPVTGARGAGQVRADHNEETDQDRGPADHAVAASGDQSPHRTSGPDQPADHDYRADGGPADHPSGPSVGTGGPDNRADHEPGDHHAAGDRGPASARQTGSEPESVGHEPHPRTTDRSGAEPVVAGKEAGDAAGLEELLSIAREAALSEGRMTRRALRPYLNEAGVPISNERFTELQRHLYADPRLAHLPRPGRRSR